MSASSDSMDRRLATLQGQIRALREHVSDSERTPQQVVRLLGLVRGGIDRVSAELAVRYLDLCFPELEREDGVVLDQEELNRRGEHRDAIHRIIGAAR